MDDSISRQAAIDAFNCTNELIIGGEANAQNVVNYINKVVGKIKDLPPAEPEIIRCVDCIHYHEDVWGDQLGHPSIPLILAHQMCDFWGDGCKTKEDGYCFAAERRTNG